MTTPDSHEVTELLADFENKTGIDPDFAAIRAALELQRGNAAQAIEQLQATSRYEAAAEFWPQYLSEVPTAVLASWL